MLNVHKKKKNIDSKLMTPPEELADKSGVLCINNNNYTLSPNISLITKYISLIKAIPLQTRDHNAIVLIIKIPI